METFEYSFMDLMVGDHNLRSINGAAHEGWRVISVTSYTSDGKAFNRYHLERKVTQKAKTSPALGLSSD